MNLSSLVRSSSFALAIAGMVTVGGVRAASATAETAASTAAQPAVDVVAKNWKFTPSAIELHVGQAAVLRLTSAEGVHGIESADLGITKTTIVPGKTSEVDFTPQKVGTYKLHCAIVCGAGHENMILTVNVVP